MKKKLVFYLLLGVLVVLDSVLITSPNLLGKIGLLIYKYYYLRTFPRALLTVSIIVSIGAAMSETIQLLLRRQMIRRITGFIMLSVLLLLSIAILIKTNIDFSAWTYGHTGSRFKYGAYILPLLLIAVFGFGLMSLPKDSQSWPVSPVMKEDSKD